MTALDLVAAEMAKTRQNAEIMAVEATNTRNDRIAIALAYLGRASEKVLRNQREACDPLENLIKAAAIICAAIDAGASP